VVTPIGQSYDVTVEWLPRWRLLAGRFSGWRARRREARNGKSSWLDNLDFLNADDLDDILAVIAIVVAVVVAFLLFWWLLLPALLLVLDGLVIAVLLVLGIVARVVLRRPWSVLVQRNDDGEPAETRVQVIGWRRALHTRDAIADALKSGASMTAATAAVPI
jgi:hypothetical protein